MTCVLQSGGAQPSSQRHSRLLSQTWEAQGGSEGLCALGRVSCPWPLKTPGVRDGKRAGVTGHREPAPRREWPLHQKRGRATPVSASYALGVPREVGAIITPTGQMRTLASEVSKPPGPRGKDWNCLRGPSLPPGAPPRPPSAHPMPMALAPTLLCSQETHRLAPTVDAHLSRGEEEQRSHSRQHS